MVVGGPDGGGGGFHEPVNWHLLEAVQWMLSWAGPADMPA
jgi:hypothetical protein